METRKTVLLAKLWRKLSDIYSDTESYRDVEKRLAELGYPQPADLTDPDADPLAKYLTAEVGAACYIGSNFVTMEYGDGGATGLNLPTAVDFLPYDFQKSLRREKKVNRLSQAVYNALDAADIAYEKEPLDIDGCPTAVLRGPKVCIFARRCKTWGHSCCGGDSSKHDELAATLDRKNYKVFTLWECQLSAGLYLELMIETLK